MKSRVAEIWKAASDALLGKPELGSHEVQLLSGVSTNDGQRFWQALGFPPVSSAERIFTRRDADALAVAAALDRADGPEHESLVHMARTTGQALSRVAHMHVLSVAREIEDAARSDSLDDGQAAERIAAIADALVRAHEPFLGYIWRRHVLAAISQIVAGAVDQSGEEASAVGFADLVDYTAISQQLGEDELIELVDHFEKIAYSEITSRGGRIVKTLGDEVMFSCPNAVTAADTALAIAAACKEDPVLTDVRVGVAIGPMLAWEGDLYGPTVNLANRLAALARPGTVLVSDELARRLAGDARYRLLEIRDVKLKGIGRAKPWVLRAHEELPSTTKKAARVKA